ncbi:MAG: putative cytokinetic ring protein SteA [Aquihabitans sp.]
MSQPEPNPAHPVSAADPVEFTGIARTDTRTKDLAKRIQPGEIAIINHKDLDTVATESLIEAGALAVVNAGPCISGRYPNVGPLLLPAAGLPVVDNAGDDLLSLVPDGTLVTISGGDVIVDGAIVATGTLQSMDSFTTILDASRRSMGDELERFASNTLEYLRREGHLLVDQPDIPDIPVDFRGRQVLVVVRGVDYKKDLQLLERSGYIREQRPLLVGVDGGADALLALGKVPDMIIGDMDSVTERALRCGAAMVVHGYADGRAPGSERLDELGVEHVVFASTGTSEDIAMLIAFERGAELIVAVGTHNSMVDFLDKGRAGMASTFLVRMKVGPILVDAKGVNRLYDSRVRKRDLLFLVLAAVFTMVVITLKSDPVRLVLRGLLLSFR